MKKQSIITLFLLCCLTSAYTQQTSHADYLSTMDKALYIEYAEVKMEVYKNDKLLKYYGMEFFRKEEKIRMEFLEPAAEKGRRMLNDKTNLWMYMPRTSKIMKLPLKQSFMGSDASNRDLMRMAFKEDYDIVSIQPNGEEMLLLELKAKDLSVSYHKMIISFDTRRQVPVTQQMYSISDKLIKTMKYDYEQQPDGKHICNTVVIRDELLKNSQTKMYYKHIRRSNNKPAVFFTLGSIKQ